jgi:hypothetical protein
MSDQLEDFIRANRSAFDDKEPSDRSWQKIESSLSFQKKTSLWNSVVMWRAAAIIFMAASAFLLLSKQGGKVRTDATALNEFTDVEAFYIEQISEKEDIIGSFARNEGLNGFTRDFEQLEAMYSVLKEEMKAHPSEKVKDALVLNLLIRIDLLNQQLHKLEKGDESAKPEEKKAQGASI